MSENSRIYPSWNPNALRSNSLPDCHWKLCLQFMDRHQNLLPQEQLLALAHIFANTQLLLRGDEDQTMELVLDLVKDQLPVGTAVEVENFENRCLEREGEPEFPDVSPVVEMEALAISASRDGEGDGEEEPEIDSSPDVEINQTSPQAEPEDTVPEPKVAPDVANQFIRVVPAVDAIAIESVYSNLILFDQNFEKTQAFFNRLNCGRLEVVLKQNIDLSYSATVKVDRHVLAKASGKKSGKAQTRAIKLFFANLRNHCYRIETLAPKSMFQSTTNVVPRLTAQQLQQANSPDRINESNGRLDPIESSTLRKGRAGIGAPLEDTIDPAHYRQVMTDFRARNEGRALVFSPEFTKQECVGLQRIAFQLRLDGRVVSLPKGVKRFAVMAPELPPQEIVRRVVIEKDASLSGQYRVVPPKRSASFVKVKPASDVVPDCRSSTGIGPSHRKIEMIRKIRRTILNHRPMRKIPLSQHDAILDSLTQFKPIRPLRSLEDVYHNLVLIGHSVARTRKEFERVGSDSLQFINSQTPDGGFCARIVVGEFVLVEAGGRSRKLARRGAKKAFCKKAAMFCYKLTPKKAKQNFRNAIAREECNIEFYRDMIINFAKDCVEQELVFGVEFTNPEQKMLQSFAQKINLRANHFGPKNNRHLRVYGQGLPALVIVERIVLHKDPALSARYEFKGSMAEHVEPHRNLYQTFLEHFRNQLPEENRAATMAQIHADLELMANGHSASAELIAQSVEIAKQRFHLGPVVEFKTLDDVYQNLVLLNDSFTETKRLFDRLKSDRLVCDLVENAAKSVATVRIGRFTFGSVEAGPTAGLTRKNVLKQRHRIMSMAKGNFMSMMRQHCYSINEKDNPNSEVEDIYFELRRTVGKSDELDLKYYRRLLKKFRKHDCGIDLIFTDEMDKMDRKCLIDIANDLNLRTRLDHRTMSLVVFSRRTGPEIVNDMITGKH
ncbi:hypothetical protein pipiens_016978, partial [Culex pipiens pipiens]